MEEHLVDYEAIGDSSAPIFHQCQKHLLFHFFSSFFSKVYGTMVAIVVYYFLLRASNSCIQATRASTDSFGKAL